MGNRWTLHDKAHTVDESLSFPVRAALTYNGAISWTRRGETAGSAAYTLEYGIDGAPVAAVLRYTITPHGGEPISYRCPVAIVTRTTAAGIVQRLWRCPLVVGGVPCARTVRAIHLPPGAAHFGCRHCHRLVYASSQEHSKYLDGIFGMSAGRARWLLEGPWGGP